MRGIENSSGEIIKAGCVVINYKKVLLVTDKDQKIWSFPKGHLEEGESLEQAAAREAQEETGCRVEIKRRLVPDVTYMNKELQKPVRLTLFLAELLNAGLAAEEKFSWVDLKRAREIIYPDLKRYI